MTGVDSNDRALAQAAETTRGMAQSRAATGQRAPSSSPWEKAKTTSSRSALLILLSVAAIAAATPGEAEDAVLISSTVDRYVPGSVITDDQTLALPAGTSAILLFRSGGIVRLKGPFEGRIDSVKPVGATGGAEGFVQALRGQGVDVTVIGATRGFTIPSARAAMSGAPVDVDVDSSAIYCVGPNDTLSLRGTSITSGIVRLRHGGNLREVAWPKGAGRIAWPADLLIEDGDRFDVVDKAGAVNATMIFHRFVPPPSATAWIASGLLSGCRTQMGPALRELALEIDKSTGS